MSYFYSTAVTCENPKDILNGKYSPMKDSGEFYEFGDVVKFSCNNKSYSLIGSTTIDCRADGQFLPDPPKCISKFQCFHPFRKHLFNLFNPSSNNSYM